MILPNGVVGVSRLADVEIGVPGQPGAARSPLPTLPLFSPQCSAGFHASPPPRLLKGFYGSKKWMAAGLGRLGEAPRSRAKVAASPKKGKLGAGRTREAQLMWN